MDLPLFIYCIFPYQRHTQCGFLVLKLVFINCYSFNLFYVTFGLHFVSLRGCWFGFLKSLILLDVFNTHIRNEVKYWPKSMLFWGGVGSILVPLCWVSRAWSCLVFINLVFLLSNGGEPLLKLNVDPWILLNAISVKIARVWKVVFIFVGLLERTGNQPIMG